MTIQTVRPNDEGHTGWNAGGYVATGGGGSLAAVTADSNPLTFMQGSNLGSVILGFGSYTLGATERCLRARARVDAASSPSADVQWYIGNFAAGKWAGNISTLVGAFGNFVGPWVSASPEGVGEWVQARIDDVNIELFTDVPAGPPVITGIYLDLDIRHKPTVAAPTVTGATTHWPTVNWTATINDSDAQKGANLRIFDLSVNSTPTVTDTLGKVYDSGVVNGTAASRTIVKGTNTGLPDGHYQVFVQVAKDFNGAYWWSDWASTAFTVATAVAAPSALQALTNNSDTPTMQCKVVGPSAGSFFATVKVEYQFATDVGFTTDIRGFIGPDSDFTRAGTITDITPQEDALFQQTWFARARAIDSYGSVSSWSSTLLMGVAHPPVATAVAPLGGNSVVYGSGSVAFAWKYFNQNSDDTQGSYQIVVVDADGNVVVDTGELAGTAPNANVTIPSTAKDQALRWKVWVWDIQDIESESPSDYAAFVVADAPDVAIVAPLADATVATPAPEIDWTFAASGGRTQTAFRISIANTVGALVYDTGWLEGDDTTFTPSTIALNQNLATFVIYLQVRDSTNLEGDAQVIIHSEWIEPDQPIGAADVSRFDLNGYVRVTWDASTKDVQWYSWRVYRRRDDQLVWTLVAETAEDQSAYVVNDFLAESGVAQDYAVVQVALRFGMQVESSYIDNMVVVTPDSDKYWLIALADYTASLRFDQVTQDSFTDETETAELLVWGRGRHIEKGQHWGVRGQFVGEIYDTDRVTASDALTAILYAKQIETDFVLRPPFGRLWSVSGGDVQFDRTPGVGKMEAATVTFPYVEVY